jgi:adenylate cyclase
MSTSQTKASSAIAGTTLAHVDKPSAAVFNSSIVHQAETLLINRVSAFPFSGSVMDSAPSSSSDATAGVTRRELTVLFADIAGYARLTEAAELTTHSRLKSIRTQIINPSIVTYRGQLIRNTGDGFIASFDSSYDAVRCAIDIQEEVYASDQESLDRRIVFRMGLNVGDVIIDDGDIYGAGVNIAARLEQCAPSGGILVSSSVLNRVRSRIDIPTQDLGCIRMKHISKPVHAFSLLIPGVDHASADGIRPRRAHRTRVPTVAVLPFRTTSDTSEYAYFAEGMVDDIIVALASIRGLLVISRTSSLSFASGELDVQEISQKLGVRYVLSGSLRRIRADLRVTYELNDTETGTVLWADQFDGPLADLFDLQDRIATRIVWTIAPQVREAELRRALRKRPDNMNAYDLVLQAIDLIYRMNFPDFDRAGKLLKRAIECDDTYAAGYTYSALWQIHNINQGWTNDHAADAQEALRLATAAVARDPSDGFALAICGHVKSVLLRDYPGSVELFDRALTAAPGNALVWTLSSGVYSYTGNPKEAIRRAEKGLRLSPTDTQAFFYLSFLALAHYLNGTFEESVIWGRKSMGLNPRLCANMRWLIASLVRLNQLKEARTVAQALLSVQPRFQISAYAQWCPLQHDLKEILLTDLSAAGVPK